MGSAVINSFSLTQPLLVQFTETCQSIYHLLWDVMTREWRGFGAKGQDLNVQAMYSFIHFI